MTAIIVSRAENAARWAAELKSRTPDRDIRVWPEDAGTLDPATVEYVIAAMPPYGEIARYPNIKAVLSLWAGVDHITADPDLSRDIPVVRMIEDGLSRGMREFVIAQVMMAHLSIPAFLRQQRDGVWRQEIRGSFGTEPLADERTVGILGLGVLGRDCASALAALGFGVVGWSRREKRIDGVTSLHGADGLDRLAREADILVNLLPRTPETENILNRDLFRRMPAGSHVINVGRGEHLVEEDLLEALDAGNLAGAALDVFRQEPLPADHPFWSHSKIVVTPHVASITRIRTGVERLISVMAEMDRGDRPDGIIDTETGY